MSEIERARQACNSPTVEANRSRQAEVLGEKWELCDVYLALTDER